MYVHYSLIIEHIAVNNKAIDEYLYRVNCTYVYVLFLCLEKYCIFPLTISIYCT